MKTTASFNHPFRSFTLTVNFYLIVSVFPFFILPTKGICQEHSFGINAGFSRNSLKDDNIDFISYGLQYTFYTPVNVFFGLNNFLGFYKKDIYTHGLIIIDPCVGYRFNIADKIYPEFCLEWGFVAFADMIPDVTFNAGGSFGIKYPLLKWLNIGIKYQLLYEYAWYNHLIDQLALECNFAIIRHKK
jgi:hypothetical protein